MVSPVQREKAHRAGRKCGKLQASELTRVVHIDDCVIERQRSQRHGQLHGHVVLAGKAPAEDKQGQG